MTKEEHQLMVVMFSRMRLMNQVLLEVLMSRDILTREDADAFSHAVQFDQAKMQLVFDMTWEDYLVAAREQKVVTGLES
jgi:hypothetical protein